MKRIVLATVVLVCSTAHGGQLGTDKLWITNATPPDQLVLNNNDYQGGFADNPNHFTVNGWRRGASISQSILATERVIPVVDSGGITEYAFTLGGFAPEFSLDNVFQVQLGFGTGDNFVRASEVASDLRFDTPDNVSPAIEDTYSIGDTPILKLMEHQGDTLIYQGSSTTGAFRIYDYASAEMLKVPLDVPDLPLSVRNAYTPADLEGLGETETAFTVRVGALPQPTGCPPDCGSSTAHFVRLGRLDPEHPRSEALGISADGSVVVGASGGWGDNTNRAFIWTAADGLVDPLPNERWAAARAVSADGNVVLGEANGPLLWNADTGVEMLNGLTGALRLSADGKTAVGWRGDFPTAEAAVWSEGSGMRPLGLLPGSTMSSGDGISADGTVVVGSTNSPDAPTFMDRAFRWTDATGLELLAGLGGNATWASDVSADGHVIVGTSEGPDGVSRAVRWDETNGAVGLGSLDEHNLSSGAIRVSGDGQTIVGWANTADANGVRGQRWFIWDEANGMRDVENMMRDQYGQDVALGGWTIASVRAVAPDGRTLAGAVDSPDGSLQEGFVFHMDPLLYPGDADQNLDFDQLDLVHVQIAAKYLTGQAATWGDGDWNGAPGGRVGSPPAGDGLFNQFDVIAAQQAGNYLTGPYAAVRANGQPNDGQTSIVYNPSTGEVAVDAPAGTELTSINIDSAGGIFTGAAAANLGGSFDNDADGNIFKATFGGSFGSLSFGNVAQPGLAEDFLLGDLAVIGSLQGGGALGDVDLIYVPEPATALSLILGTLTVFARRRRVSFVSAWVCVYGNCI